MKTRQLLAAALAAGFVATSASAAIIDDNFDVDSSANYTQVDDTNTATVANQLGSFDGTVTHAYDYSADGIAAAPNTVGGTTIGLRMTANDTGGAASHVSLFHNTAVSGDYTVQVDIYMGVTGSGGTTEFANVGVGSSGTDYNSIFTPISGDGRFLSMTGEGGSSSDYRHFVNGTPVNSGDATYLNDLNTTNATGDTYQNIYPNTDFPGSPGNSWTTLLITVNGSTITYSLDGTAIIQDTIASQAGETDGFVGLSYGDVFTSIATPFQSQFVIYDNLVVTQIPEPGSLALLGLGGLAMLRRRR